MVKICRVARDWALITRRMRYTLVVQMSRRGKQARRIDFSVPKAVSMRRFDGVLMCFRFSLIGQWLRQGLIAAETSELAQHHLSEVEKVFAKYR